MNKKDIREYMIAMGKYGINKFHYKEAEVEIYLEKTSDANIPSQNKTETHSMKSTSEVKGAHVDKAIIPGEVSSSSEETEGAFVTSPMVGTFYEASSPDDAAFVKVGDYVKKDTVVCIIEAMKVMNEIKSDVEGTVAEVLVKNGHPVEFGTKMFKVV